MKASLTSRQAARVPSKKPCERGRTAARPTKCKRRAAQKEQLTQKHIELYTAAQALSDAQLLRSCCTYDVRYVH
eukprot:590725-Pleurochrysis_carterae.AAC.1